MISTITSSIVAALTTSAIAGSLALVGVLVLIALLIQKELASAASDARWKQLGQLLDIGILPLSIAFLLLVVFKII
jgi:hypothetical protein